MIIGSILVVVAFASWGLGYQIARAGDVPPQGCAASNVDYYFDHDTGAIDWAKMAELTWIPVSAADSATIVGCVPYNLWDPTFDDNQALLEYGQGDANVPLPIFDFKGELTGYFVAYQGSVSVSEAIAEGEVPDHLVQEPPTVDAFDPGFESWADSAEAAD